MKKPSLVPFGPTPKKEKPEHLILQHLLKLVTGSFENKEENVIVMFEDVAKATGVTVESVFGTRYRVRNALRDRFRISAHFISEFPRTGRNDEEKEAHIQSLSPMELNLYRPAAGSRAAGFRFIHPVNRETDKLWLQDLKAVLIPLALRGVDGIVARALAGEIPRSLCPELADVIRQNTRKMDEAAWKLMVLSLPPTK